MHHQDAQQQARHQHQHQGQQSATPANSSALLSIVQSPPKNSPPKLPFEVGNQAT